MFILVGGKSILSCQHIIILHAMALPYTLETTPMDSVAGPPGGDTKCVGIRPMRVPTHDSLAARSRLKEVLIADGQHKHSCPACEEAGHWHGLQAITLDKDRRLRYSQKIFISSS